MNTEPTPGPLNVVEGVNLQSDPTGCLAYVSVAGARGRTLDEAKANAPPGLALCWNCHDELVAACRAFISKGLSGGGVAHLDPR